jgi:hypothetical protein
MSFVLLTVTDFLLAANKKKISMRHFTDDLAQPSVPTTGSSTFPGIAQTSDQQSDHKAEKVIKK